MIGAAVTLRIARDDLVRLSHSVGLHPMNLSSMADPLYGAPHVVLVGMSPQVTQALS